MAEKKRNDQIARHQALFEEVMNQSDVQLLQTNPDAERNSVEDIIGSAAFVQIGDDAEKNSASDIIGSAGRNQSLLQMYMSQEEIDSNSPADMIGSGPEFVGYLNISDSKTKITE